MPQLDQGALFEQLAVNERSLEVALSTGTAASGLLQTPLAVYRCPSDPGGNNGPNLVHQNRHFGGGRGTDAGSLGEFAPAASNYVGVQGNREHTPSQDPPHNNGSLNAIFYFNSAEVKPGTNEPFDFNLDSKGEIIQSDDGCGGGCDCVGSCQ